MKDQNVLVHHGIKGMKWGVRRTPEQLGHAPSKKRKISIKISKSEPKKQTTQKASSESAKKKKSVKEMSDEEIRKVINRIELERKYTSLTAPQQSKGKKIVKDILAKSATNVATKYTTKAMDKIVENLLKSMSGSSGGSGGGSP